MHMCAGPRPPLPPCVLGCARLKPPLPPMLRTYYVHSPFPNPIGGVWILRKYELDKSQSSGPSLLLIMKTVVYVGFKLNEKSI